MVRIVYGLSLADEIMTSVKESISRIHALGRQVYFTTLLVGDNPSSVRYIDMKKHEGDQLGIRMNCINLPEHTSQETLERTIQSVNDGKSDGILIQYPLPSHLNYVQAISCIDPRKDVDGLHPANLGLLLYDPRSGSPRLAPCTPQGIIKLLERNDVGVHNANVAVIGRGLTVGAPLSILLSARYNGPSATVSLLHTGTRNLSMYTKQADIIVGASGSPGLITDDMINERAVLVSVGITYIHGKARSDFARAALHKASVVIPVINGIGPMTRAYLWSNLLRCYELRHGAVSAAS